MVDLTELGFLVVLVGIAIIMVASLASSRNGPRSEGEGERTKVRGGGVVMIGPIPIIFGTDAKWAIVAIVLAAVLLFLGLAFNYTR